MNFHIWANCSSVYLPLVQEAGVPTCRGRELNNDVTVQQKHKNRQTRTEIIKEYY